MNSAVVAETFSDTKKSEYIRFAEKLGVDVCFTSDKWICDTLRRSPAEKTGTYTLYFDRIPALHKDAVKYFAIISLVQNKSIATVKTYIGDLIRFFDFWTSYKENGELCTCNEFAVADFYQHLESRELAEATNIGIWSSMSTFFKTMNGWDNKQFKNPFSISPYCRQRKYYEKYIPEDVVNQLDHIFKKDEIDLYLRCVYWILRLIPSRISEVVGMPIECLKRFDGKYVLFIPTWKQNGGWRRPVTRSIHLEEKGIAAYLIRLIEEQQEAARQLQEYMPDNKQGALFTYRQRNLFRREKPYYTRLCFVATRDTVRTRFQDICVRYGVRDQNGNPYKVTTHQFRHNGITDRLAAGFTAAQIADMTGHHGDAMIYNAYAHLDLKPETIVEKQKFVSGEPGSRDERYILFGGRILNMNEQLEKRLLKNLRAHRVRGGICSDITGCKSDMWNCLECKFFVPDAEQRNYYIEQIALWKAKQEKFREFPLIRENAERNVKLFECVLKKIDKDVNP